MTIIKNLMLPLFVVFFMLGHVAFAGDDEQNTENKMGCCDEMSMKDCGGMMNGMMNGGKMSMEDCDSMKSMMDGNDMMMK